MNPDDLEPEVDGGPSNRSRILWTFSDQALSSLTNFALVIVVAKNVTKSDFGSFSLAMVTFTFLIGLGRSLVGDPYVVRFTDADRHTRRRATRQASGAAVSFGVISGLVCIAAAMVLTGQSRMAMLALGISMPGLMLQENWRHIFFAEGRARAATINDGLWTVIQFALIGVLLVQDRPSIFLITIAWGISALVAGLFGIIQARVVPDPFEALAWYRETRELNVKMGLDFAFNQGATTLVGYLITAVVGTVGIGAIRAAQSLLGPLNLLFAGISAFGMPVLARAAMAGSSLLKQALALSAAIGVMASTWVAILIFVPDKIGAQIMGDSWDTAHEVMLPMGIITVTVAFVLGASLGLKALRRADQMLRVTFMQAPLMLGLGALGGAVFSIRGAAWGMCIAQLVGFVACWIIFLRADRLPRPWIDEENESGPEGQAPGEFDGERHPEPRNARDRYDRDGFWSQDEQDRWALEESEQLYGGQQAEEVWQGDERQRRPQPGRPRGYEDQRDPRDDRGYRDDEHEGRTPAEGWYDPQEPTIAVRHDPRNPSGGLQRPESPSAGVYDPQEPTVLVRHDRNDRNGRQRSQSPSGGVYDPQEPTVVARPVRNGRQGPDSPSEGLYDPQEPTVVARPGMNGLSGPNQQVQPPATPAQPAQPARPKFRAPWEDEEPPASRSGGYDRPDPREQNARGQERNGYERHPQDGYDDRAGYGRDRGNGEEQDRGRGSRGRTDYDREQAGYDRNRDSRDSRDQTGYDRAGYNQAGYDQAGYNGAGYNDAGYNRAGYNDAGYDHDGYNEAGYNRAGYNDAGYDHDGYNAAGYNQAGYNQAGYNQAGYNQAGYNQAGYDQGGYDQTGYDRAGYDQEGQDRDGRGRRGREQGGHHPQDDQRYPDEAYANERPRGARPAPEEPDPWPFPEQGQGRRGR